MSRKPTFAVRLPPDPESAAVEAFVRGEEPAPAEVPAPSAPVLVERPDVQTSKRLVHRRDGRILRRSTIYLPADVAKRLRAHCAAADVDVSDFLAELVAERLTA